jgi:PAS domain S-box-containing protein
MLIERSSVAARYLFAVVVVTVATLLRYALEPVLDFRAPFILYFPAVVVCAWFGALWPGIFSTALSALITWYLFIPPQHSFRSSDPTAPAQLIIFLLGGVLMSLLAESLHPARATVEISEAKEREQHERLRVTLASIGDAVITTDSRGRVDFMNSIAESLTGWTNDLALGKPLGEVFNIINEQTRMPVENPALRAMREGKIFGLANHTILIGRTGGEVPIDDSGSPIADSKGVVRGAVLVFRDITERRKAEETRATFAAIVQSSEDPIISKTIDGTISSWNPAAERMFEYTATEAIGQPVTIIVPTDRLEEEGSILDRMRRGERITSLETVRRSKGGKLLDISVTISPVRDSSDRIVGASKIIRDIAERKRADQERAKLLASESAAREQAEAASRSKDQFLAMVSHELRSPLNAVLGGPSCYAQADSRALKQVVLLKS